MLDVEDDHGSLMFVDLVENSPLATEASAVDANQGFPERLSDPVGFSKSGPVISSAAATATSGGSRSARARRAGGAVPSS